MTEIELLDGLIQNQRAAYNYVYKTLAPPVFAFVKRNSGNHEDAEDLFQETFLKALIKIQEGKYKSEYKFEAWFITIARNTWLDILRGGKKKKTESLDDSLLQLADESNEDALIHLILHDNRLDQLSRVWESWKGTMCQRILNAFYFENTRTKDIAKTEEVNQNALLARLFNCKKKLYKLMGDYPLSEHLIKE